MVGVLGGVDRVAVVGVCKWGKNWLVFGAHLSIGAIN